MRWLIRAGHSGIIEPIIDRANDDVSKLLLLDKDCWSGVTRNGGSFWINPQIPIDYSMFKYSAGVVALAKSDFASDQTPWLTGSSETCEWASSAANVGAARFSRNLEQTPSRRINRHPGAPQFE